MATPFNSDKFLTDPFFASAATIAGSEVAVVVEDLQQPQESGNLVKRPGHWITVLVRKSDVASAPALNSEFTYNSKTYRVDHVTDSVDCWQIAAVGEQRRTK